MIRISRRAALGALAAAPLARPAILRAQSSSKPVRIGLLSDLTGPYRDDGGPGDMVTAKMAVEDFGGSVLGSPIEILQADVQNKPEIAAAKGRQWIDDEGVDALADGAASSSGLAIQQISREKKRIYMAADPAATDFIGKQCSPYGFQFVYDTYALAKGTGGELTKAGGNTWFFITVDYAFGYSLEENTSRFVKEAEGKVLGSVRVPLGTADFSSYLVRAKASGAKVIGLANAGTDLQNCIKQAAEFGIAKGGQRLATLLMAIADVKALGQDVCQGLVLTNSFYWDLDQKTRDWTKRFNQSIDEPPTMQRAGCYAAVLHYLKAVKAVGTVDADAVAAKMRETPVNDFYNTNVRIDPNGCVRHTMYVWEVKPSSEAKHRWDYYKPVATMDGEHAFPPPAMFGCPLVHA
ncbi:MAG TPA: ABC transporter substrate-binding protein [Acetobacteraceae bacterium]|nr:ABC transporter substrate-binding protein [Acetobacteraceae bacterium]